MQDERFGVSEKLISRIGEKHCEQKILRSGCYVPTETEVQTMSLDQLTSIVVDWLWESPSELIPNNDQIIKLKTLLLTRADCSHNSPIVRECDDFISN